MRKILWVKRAKRTRKSPKKAKPGAFWVLEGMGTVGDGYNQMRKPGVRTNVNHITMQHKKTGENTGFSPVLWQGQKVLARLTARVLLPGGERPAPTKAGVETGSRQSATGTHCPFGTRFCSGCGNTIQGPGEGRCCPVPAASPRESGAILVLRAALAAVFQVFYTFSFL